MNIERKDLYTMRWYLNQTPPQTESALEILNRLLGDVKQPVQIGLGRGLLTCPFAVHQDLPQAKTRGKYQLGYPQGAVVHFTAGNHKQKPLDAVQQMVNNGYVYFIIAPDGTIYQNFQLDQWGYHAGDSEKYPSEWEGLGFGVSDKIVGIEIMSPGRLNDNRSPWYDKNKVFPKEQCRFVEGDEQQQRGWYVRYTDEQERSLFELLGWLKSNKPDVFNYNFVLGHDEVSGPRGIGWRRKNDPGGALSMSMDELRNKLLT